jgi:hypothetical protein
MDKNMEWVIEKKVQRTIENLEKKICKLIM